MMNDEWELCKRAEERRVCYTDVPLWGEPLCVLVKLSANRVVLFSSARIWGRGGGCLGFGCIGG